MGDTLEGISGQKGNYVSITTLCLNEGCPTRVAVLWVLGTFHLGKKELLGDESVDFQHRPLSVPHRPVTGRQADGRGEASTHAGTPSKTSPLDADSAAYTETRLPLQNRNCQRSPLQHETIYFRKMARKGGSVSIP